MRTTLNLCKRLEINFVVSSIILILILIFESLEQTTALASNPFEKNPLSFVAISTTL
jgi:hypothetical protein